MAAQFEHLVEGNDSVRPARGHRTVGGSIARAACPFLEVATLCFLGGIA
jgi:hypothetical protein